MAKAKAANEVQMSRWRRSPAHNTGFEKPELFWTWVVNLRSEGHSGSSSEWDERENGRNSA